MTTGKRPDSSAVAGRYCQVSSPQFGVADGIRIVVGQVSILEYRQLYSTVARGYSLVVVKN